MSLRTFGKSSRFLLSIIVINFFDPLLASIPPTRVHLRFSSQNSSFNVCGVLSVAAECNFVGPLFAPLGRAVEESLMACSPQYRHRENPSLHKNPLAEAPDTWVNARRGGTGT